MEDPRVEDMGSKGYPFTWCNNRSRADQISQRLDRALMNEKWPTEYPRSRCINELALGSDHSPLIIQTTEQRKRVTRRFKFEEMWLEDPRCKDVIRDAWGEPDTEPNAGGIQHRLRRCRTTFTQWSKAHFGNNARKLNELKNQLGRRVGPHKTQAEVEEDRHLKA